MRSLPELGALISECASDLKNDTVSVENAERLLEQAKAKQAATLARFDALSVEMDDARKAALAKGLRQSDDPSAGEAFDAAAAEARVTEAFERATTLDPYGRENQRADVDQTAIFSNGQSF